MLEGILLHMLKGVPGGLIDISKVIDFGWNKRIFCILQRNYPYKVWIKYDRPTTTFTAVPTYTTNGTAITVIPTYSPTQIIEARYKSQEEAIDEVLEIKQKKKQFEEYRVKVYTQIINDIKVLK